ncbi:MAG: GTPase HflX [Acidobacteria bacterium]|nr:GTPase HflX [Acidobacteriota bacterium]
MRAPRPVERPERALLVGVRLPARYGGSSDDSLAELEQLARRAGADIAGTLEQIRDRPDPATLIGRGKAEEVHREAEARGADLVIFDHDLTPTQLRNLTGEQRVIDRTQLILDIFARRARSREGQLQVELAQLNYLLPRLTGKGVELSRLGGGIGTRGPGETQLETDRRRIRRRLQRIRRELEAVRRRRAQQRQARQGMALATAALVGYTSAGKSTLFNALTGAEVEVSGKLFATLDPTVRALALPSGRRALLSDTVGFIRNLPPGLVAAFRATLEEVEEAAIILHVSDVSNPQHPEQDQEVVKVLAELGVEQRPRLMVYNKIDLLAEDERRRLENSARAVFVSALAGLGLEDLRQGIDALLPADRSVRLWLRFSAADGRQRALVHQQGRVLNEEFRDGSVWMEAEVPAPLARELEEFAVRRN